MFIGYLSDKFYAKRAPVAALAVLITGLLCISITINYKDYSQFVFSFYLFIIGILLGGTHHMLCITVSADLGNSHA